MESLVFFLEHKDKNCFFKKQQHSKLQDGEFYTTERPSWKFRCNVQIPLIQHSAVEKLLKKYNKVCYCATQYKCTLCTYLCPETNEPCIFFNEFNHLDLKYFEKFLAQNPPF